MSIHAPVPRFEMLAATLALSAAACGSGNGFDRSRCADLLNAAIEDGRFQDAVAADAVGRVSYQAADDWEGGTPVCWVSVGTATRCQSFVLDLTLGPTPPGWTNIGTATGPCKPELDAEFPLSSAMDTRITPSRAVQSIAHT